MARNCEDLTNFTFLGNFTIARKLETFSSNPNLSSVGRETLSSEYSAAHFVHGGETFPKFQTNSQSPPFCGCQIAKLEGIDRRNQEMLVASNCDIRCRQIIGVFTRKGSIGYFYLSDLTSTATRWREDYEKPKRTSAYDSSGIIKRIWTLSNKKACKHPLAIRRRGLTN